MDDKVTNYLFFWIITLKNYMHFFIWGLYIEFNTPTNCLITSKEFFFLKGPYFRNAGRLFYLHPDSNPSFSCFITRITFHQETWPLTIAHIGDGFWETHFSENWFSKNENSGRSSFQKKIDMSLRINFFCRNYYIKFW